jgi:hypothetical protein
MANYGRSGETLRKTLETDESLAPIKTTSRQEGEWVVLRLTTTDPADQPPGEQGHEFARIRESVLRQTAGAWECIKELMDKVGAAACKDILGVAPTHSIPMKPPAPHRDN